MMKSLEQLTCFLVLLMIVKSTMGQRGSSRNRKVGSWGKWGEYGPCSATCGVGEMTRSRNCPRKKTCSGNSRSSIECSPGACVSSNSAVFPDYSEWSSYSECSVPCGGGVRSRTRNCLIASCTEHEKEINNCNVIKCSDKCSDHGSSRACRKFISKCFIERIRVECHKTCGVCKENREEEMSWSDYGSCSVTCGAGIQMRSKGSVTQSITCIFYKCKSEKPTWGSWGAEEPCSVSCGGGQATRTRTCSVPGACEGPANQVNRCQIQPCQDIESQQRWLPWIDVGTCSVTCGGGGLQARKRTCTKTDACSGPLETTVPCGDQQCPAWKDWGAWSACSADCGSGIRTRERECNLPGQCIGDHLEKDDCYLKDCPPVPAWKDWGAWSACSADCGSGIRTRERECNLPGQCVGDHIEQDDCYLKDCPPVPVWTKWTGWTECDVTCEAGKSERARKCSVANQCDGNNREERTCAEEPCPYWNEWKDVASCSKTCGEGTLIMRRQCSKLGLCQGNTDKSVPCNLQDCPTWTEWSEWGPCSMTCGTGESTRTRACTLLNGCIGSSVETDECIVKPCEAPQWSRCSKSCGGGTRRRYWCNGADCIWQFEGCGEGKCPATPCGAFGIFFANRYNSTHECCVRSHAPQGEQCGHQVKEIKEQSSERRIIGGVAAVADQWPWMVAVHMAEGGFCAGSLISRKFVLSAAHCFASDSGQPRNVSTWLIYAGILKLAQFSPELGLKIQKTYIHADYTYPIADIALVELEKEIDYTPFIQPICLPHGEITPDDSTCFVTGWGVSTVPDAVTNHLQELDIRNFDQRVCVEAYGKHDDLKDLVPFLKENKGYLCAGSLSREVDSCSGDSGGPLVCQRCDSCSWYIAGVVSFGPNPCALVGVPAVYSKVVYYEDWIFETTKMTRHSLSCSKPQ